MLKATIVILIAFSLSGCRQSSVLHDETQPRGTQYDLSKTSEQWLSDSDLILARQLIDDFKHSDKDRGNDELYLEKVKVDKNGNYYFIFNVNISDLFVLYIVDAKTRKPTKRILGQGYATE